MGCLFALFGGLFPRLALLVLWIARPALVGAAFNTFLLPLLGIIFLPFATLIYVIVYTPADLRYRLHPRYRPHRLRLVLGDSRRPARHQPLDGKLHPTQPDPRGTVNAGNHGRDLPVHGDGRNSVTRRTTDGGER
jgi:hypothetical protein